MSVAELPDRREEAPVDYGRTPPQDVAAEQSVLGGMLLSKDAIADVVEIIRGNDFYRPAHEAVYEAIIDLYGRGEPADAVTVAAQLQKRGELGRVGGAPYLHTLVSSVPSAANAGFYAEIVRERAVLRRLVEAGTRITQMGYSDDGDADMIVDRAQAEIYAITEKRSSEDYHPLSEIMEGTLDEIEAIGSRGGQMVGVPTGFTDLDALTNGLHPGQLVILAARPAVGKALALDTPLPTPTGWTTMGEVRVGDLLIGADGRPTKVVAATEVMTDRPCYEVEFSDGTVIVADAQHQWATTTRAGRRAAGERRSPRFYWPDASVARACAIATRAETEADHLVTAAEAVAEVGAEFRHAIHGAVQAVRAGAPAPHRAAVPTYSRRLLLSELAHRVSRPVGSWAAAEHPGIVTTEELAATLRCAGGDRRLNHAVRLADAFDLPDRDLPLPAYALGVWLGDGHSAAARFTSDDPEIAEEIRRTGLRVQPQGGRLYSLRMPEPAPVAERSCVVCGASFVPKTSQVRTCGRRCGGRVRGLPGVAVAPACPDCGRPSSGLRRCEACHRHHGTVQAVLRTMGVLGDKHIPREYLRASIQQRRDLLAGLLDTDGYVNQNGLVQFAVTSRRLAEGALELVHSLGYRASMTTKRVKGRSEATSTSYCITFTPRDAVFRLRRKRQRQRLGSGPTARMVVDVRPVPSVPVRCVEVDAADHLYLAGRSCIPTHNSTLGLDLARAASIKHGLTSVVYSLEMGRNEITMRLLSAEAKVPLHHMRSGQMTDDDWNRIARSTGEVSSAPLFIDDSPNMTMMEIRAKCRRLKQRNDLRLVIIDYLQLMTSGKRVESRQQEVAEFSRALKLLAKELEVPVIAMSQLNRGPEQRQDKKPMLSDLRESGCLPASTRILRADTGAEITIGALLASGERDIPVWSLDDSLRYVPRTMTHAFPSGRKETFRLRLASGKQIDATANHPFLTYDGWRPLGELSVGARLGVPRHVPGPLVTQRWADAEIVMLAHLIGDGSFVRRQPIRYASVDEENLAAVTEAARHFGITAVRDDYAAARVTTLRLPAPYRLTHGRRNPIAAWLDGLGLFGLRSPEKFVPDAVFGLPKTQITLFLRHLWATDGSVTVNRNGRSGRIYFATTSRRLLDGVSRLLLRYGISTRLRVATPKAGYRPQYTLDISGRDEQLRFLREIGCHGARSEGCERLLTILESGSSNANVDTVPREVWQDVRTILAEQGMSHRAFAAAMKTRFGGSTMWKHAPSRDRLGRVATVLGSAELEMYATNDLLWDEIVAIEPLGEQDVYDATVMGTHNFIADGVATHNSIEQDADMVILLHREDAYEKESPRAGEADFIVAKHRNGPTATITVAFQGHYSRFVDMAQ
ncbi:replicative DNA helicase [Jiangella muralis]|uniref:replicative DNA helicase n=1 Tax=Jiangella muralis TaxID=702383 RepID=UPI00069F6C81|nr:replicative DNA helicase [Jiangella muralis]